MHIHSIHTSYYHDLSISLLYLFYFNPTHPLDYQSTSGTQLSMGVFKKCSDRGRPGHHSKQRQRRTQWNLATVVEVPAGGAYFFGLRLESPCWKTYSRFTPCENTNPNVPEKEMGQPTKGKSLRSHPHIPGRYPGCFTNSLWRISFLCWVLGKFGVSSQGMWAKSFKEYIFQVLGVFYLFQGPGFAQVALLHRFHTTFMGTKSWDPNKKISRDGPKMEKMFG